MKKILLFVLCMGMLSTPMLMAAPVAAEATSQSSAQSSVRVTAIGYMRKGNFNSTTRAQVTVYFDSEGNPTSVTYGGESYSVRVSDRDGYAYCFYTSNRVFYFNL